MCENTSPKRDLEDSPDNEPFRKRLRSVGVQEKIPDVRRIPEQYQQVNDEELVCYTPQTVNRQELLNTQYNEIEHISNCIINIDRQLESIKDHLNQPDCIGPCSAEVIVSDTDQQMNYVGQQLSQLLPTEQQLPGSFVELLYRCQPVSSSEQQLVFFRGQPDYAGGNADLDKDEETCRFGNSIQSGQTRQDDGLQANLQQFKLYVKRPHSPNIQQEQQESYRPKKARLENAEDSLRASEYTQPVQNLSSGMVMSSPTFVPIYWPSDRNACEETPPPIVGLLGNSTSVPTVPTRPFNQQDTAFTPGNQCSEDVNSSLVKKLKRTIPKRPPNLPTSTVVKHHDVLNDTLPAFPEIETKKLYLDPEFQKIFKDKLNARCPAAPSTNENPG